MQYRTDLSDFVHDLLDFMIEQIEDAYANPRQRAFAVDAVSHARTLIGERLKQEDERLLTAFTFIGVLDRITDHESLMTELERIQEANVVFDALVAQMNEADVQR